MTTLDVGQTAATGAGSGVKTGAAAPKTRSRRRTFLVLAGLFLGATCLVMLSPFIWTIMSVTKSTDVAFVNPPVFAYRPTLAAFVDLWQTTEFYRYLINTVIIAVICTVVALLIGLGEGFEGGEFLGRLLLLELSAVEVVGHRQALVLGSTSLEISACCLGGGYGRTCVCHARDGL